MSKEKKQELYDKYQAVIIASVYNALFTNDICCGLVIDAVYDLKKSKYYKHKMKQLTRELEREQLAYEKMMNKIVGKANKSDYFAETNQRFAEMVEDDVTRLYFSFKKIFDREKMPDAELMAKVETARTLCEFSCVQLDKRAEDLAKLGAEFKRTPLLYLRLTKMSRLLNLIMDCFKPSTVINLDVDECQKALDVVMIKLGDPIAITNAINV